jgi:hypothetical protein
MSRPKHGKPLLGDDGNNSPADSSNLLDIHNPPKGDANTTIKNWRYDS